jgi:hypothetical protein
LIEPAMIGCRIIKKQKLPSLTSIELPKRFEPVPVCNKTVEFSTYVKRTKFKST